MHLIFALERLLDVPLGVAACQLPVLLRPLPQLLPLDWVVCSGGVRGWLLRENVLDGEDFVEEVELLLGNAAVRVHHSRSVELRQSALDKSLTYLLDVLEAVD